MSVKVKYFFVIKTKKGKEIKFNLSMYDDSMFNLLDGCKTAISVYGDSVLTYEIRAEASVNGKATLLDATKYSVAEEEKLLTELDAIMDEN